MLGLVGRHALVAPAPFTVVQQNPARIGIDAVTPAPFVETGAEAGFGQVRARQAGAGHHRGAVVVLDAVLAVGAVRRDVVAGAGPAQHTPALSGVAQEPDGGEIGSGLWRERGGETVGVAGVPGSLNKKNPTPCNKIYIQTHTT